MCICVNCKFYKTCWIKNGLNKIDPYLDLYLIKRTVNQNKNVITNTCLELNLLLNLFLLNERLELDVIECSAFCESAGTWLK
uniref:Uncharacterized protein n=1 Tax=Pseudellipsoidion edaphicum TaxID=1431838 RepID=A0A3R5QSW8_9STRA|nr:hypothetical protein Ycf34 [Pseudellipsoidion edaphicum]QAA12060.1 hypothetical protein Ycf34 [Pseudellipsoidion edaphicum]